MRQVRIIESVDELLGLMEKTRAAVMEGSRVEETPYLPRGSSITIEGTNIILKAKGFEIDEKITAEDFICAAVRKVASCDFELKLFDGADPKFIDPLYTNPDIMLPDIMELTTTSQHKEPNQ